MAPRGGVAAAARAQQQRRGTTARQQRRRLTALLLAALVPMRGAAAAAVCPVTAAQVLPFIPDAPKLQAACKSAPGASGCNLPCLCVFGQTLQAAVAAAGAKSLSGVEKSILQACAIDSLGPLYARGLSTNDILRVSYCDFNSSTAPACLRAPPPPSAGAPPAPPPRADGNASGTASLDGTGGPSAAARNMSPMYRGAFVAVVVASCVTTFAIVAALAAFAFGERAASNGSSGSGVFDVRCIEYRDITAEVRPRRSMKALLRMAPAPPRRVILEHVSVTLRRGDLLAIIGPSGCGKSTLLSVMAGEQVLHGRAGALAVRGGVALDGAEACGDGVARLRRAAGFVAQDDVLPPTLTVREAVAFSAALRLCAGTSPAAAAAAVDAVISRCGLRHVADNRLGGANAARGVSGGERRRVSIAQELVTDPPLLLLDEPTSGLDSFNAAALVDTLRGLAADGRAVAAAVHQPSAAVFSQFSSALLLASGRALWRGAPADAPAALAAARAPCPPGRTVADQLLRVASTPRAAARLAHVSGERPHDWHDGEDGVAQQEEANDADDVTMDDATAALLSARLHGAPSPRRSAGVLAAAAVAEGAPPPARLSPASPRGGGAGPGAAAELRALTWREALHYARSPSLLLTHLAVAVLLAIWIGIIYLHVPNNLAGFQNRAGAAFFSITSFGFGGLSALELFVADRPLFAKERHRYYSPVSYYAVKAGVDTLFLRLLPSALYGAIMYWMMGWAPSAAKFGVFMAGLLLATASTSALAIAVSMCVATVGVGAVVMSFLLLQMAIFGGFLSNTAAMPAAVAWLRFTSLFYYAFEVLLSNELSGLTLDFSVEGFASVRDIDGDRFLSTLNQNPKRVGQDLACLAVLTLLLHAAGALALTLRAAPPGGYSLLRVPGRLRRTRKEPPQPATPTRQPGVDLEMSAVPERSAANLEGSPE